MNDLTRHPAHRIAAGLAAVGIGTLALLDRQQVADLPLLHTFWPLALVLLGLARLGWARHAGGLGGVALIAVGGLLTARNLGLTGFSLHDAWPMFVILAGLALVLRGVRTRPSAGAAGR